MNLKELLECYLVEEIYPKVDVTPAKAETKAYAISLAHPTASIASTTYMNKVAVLAEVGEEYKFKGITLVEDASHNGPTTINSTSSTITGMKYGAATTVGGTVDPTRTSDTAEATTAEATYTTNFDDAVATVTFRYVKGFTGMATDTSTVTGLDGKALSLPEQTGTIVEGDSANQIKLEWSNTATVTREIEGDSVEALGKYYYASNKGNTNEAHVAETKLIDWVDNFENATAVTYTTTSLTVTGVYAIYTNGGTVSDSPASATGGSYSATPKKIDIYNYYTSSDKIKYIKFGAIPADLSAVREIYFPKDSKKTFSITSAMAYDPTSKGYNEINVWNNSGEEKTINGKQYYIWRCNQGGLGGNDVKITIKTV